MVALGEIKAFMAQFAYPADAQEELAAVYARILADETLCARMDEAARCLMEETPEREAYLAALEGVAEAVNAATQTIPLLCMMQARFFLGTVTLVWPLP